VLLRRGWFPLTGPMFYHDLVRTTRRSRFALYRCYAYFTLILVVFFYSVWFYWTKEAANGPRNHVGFAQSFFYTFTILQLFLAAMIAPAYTAGAIAEEKERRTLEFILATDLRNREIILSKLGTRLANLCLIPRSREAIFSWLSSRATPCSCCEMFLPRRLFVGILSMCSARACWSSRNFR
jgi:hypothetical protein